MNATGLPVAVVDDDEGVRELLCEALLRAGLPARAYASAEDFLAEEAETLSGCAVIDSLLPGISGTELITMLRAGGNDLPVIFISGAAGALTFHHAHELGAQAMFEKPFDVAALVRRVAGLCTTAPPARAIPRPGTAAAP
jgi:FixJ family two-component response regulator